MKTVFITGASAGIGKMTAKLFAEKGWNVIATMRSPEKETELNKLSNVTVLRLDVTDEESIKNAVDQVLAKFGTIDVLVNNAGYGVIGALESASYDDYYRQFNTNLFGAIRMIQAVLPTMREKKSGVIINLSSVAEIVGSPFGSLYHSSKWAVSGLSESIQYELYKFNIQVKMVLPPPVKTKFFESSMSVLKKEGLNIYDDSLNKSFWLDKKKLEKIYIKPQTIAKIIYRAATDGKKKMRYNAGSAGLIWFFRKLLPDCVMFWIIRKLTL